MSGPTTHRVITGDARDLSVLPDESVHLVCTSPPYAFLKQYTPGVDGQLGDILDYEDFLDQLDDVWRECHRVLVPGGRIACVVGDVCISRRRGGRHYVLPLSADIQVRSRRIGLDNLTPIRWYKVANIQLEASSSSVYLGKPNQPNGIIKNDVEHILLLRKPGGYRQPTEAMKSASHISTDKYREWYSSIWSGVTGQLRTTHPAPYPLEIPKRLIHMFSFAGDTVLDPFGGTGTTMIAAMEAGRSSVSYEIDPSYVEIMRERLVKQDVIGKAIFEASPAPSSSLAEASDRVRARLQDALLSAKTESEIRAAIAEAQALLDGDASAERITAG